MGKRLEQLNAARMSAAGEDLTEPNLYLRHSAQMQTSLATWTKTASFQYENWRFCCFHLVNSLKVELTHPAYSSIHDTFRW